MAAPTKKTGTDRRRAAARRGREFVPPPTVTLAPMLVAGGDVAFREALYLMALAFGRLQSFRQAFGRELSLTASQFIVLIGTAYRQERDGVTIRALADHTQLAATHVTTEVGRLIRMGLLIKRANRRDRRGVLVKLSRRGEQAILSVAPFVRDVNDLLFQHIPRKDFAVVSRFLRAFALNTERAFDEIRRRQLQQGMLR
jgi:DNA-binding MarR family transcriptional regulator